MVPYLSLALASYSVIVSSTAYGLYALHVFAPDISFDLIQSQPYWDWKHYTCITIIPALLVVANVSRLGNVVSAINVGTILFASHFPSGRLYSRTIFVLITLALRVLTETLVQDGLASLLGLKPRSAVKERSTDIETLSQIPSNDLNPTDNQSSTVISTEVPMTSTNTEDLLSSLDTDAYLENAIDEANDNNHHQIITFSIWRIAKTMTTSLLLPGRSIYIHVISYPSIYFDINSAVGSFIGHILGRSSLIASRLDVFQRNVAGSLLFLMGKDLASVLIRWNRKKTFLSMKVQPFVRM